jgi:prepilin-type N-terminal cleavage/methylation domain-containing protein
VGLSKGFTLVEIVITLALLSLLAGLGLFVTLGAYQGSVSRSEREVVVSLLERARSRAMANVGESAWGLCFIAPNYILFKGTSCTQGASSEVTAAGAHTEVAGLDGVSFAQLSGQSASTTIAITQNRRTEEVTINHEGTIAW